MPFISLLKKTENGIRSAQRMQQGPVPEGLNRVVRTIEGAPSRRVRQIAAFVKIFGGEAFDGERIVTKQFAFQQSPSRRRHGRLDAENRLGAERLRAQQSGLGKRREDSYGTR